MEMTKKEEKKDIEKQKKQVYNHTLNGTDTSHSKERGDGRHYRKLFIELGKSFKSIKK